MADGDAPAAPQQPYQDPSPQTVQSTATTDEPVSLPLATSPPLEISTPQTNPITPVRGTTPLPPPTPPFMDQMREQASEASLPVGSSVNSVQRPSSTNALYPDKAESSGYLQGQEGHAEGRAKSRRSAIFAALGLLAAVVIAVVLGVYFGVIRNKANGPNPSPATSPGPASPSPSNKPIKEGNIIYGGDGTTVKTEQGQTFTYSNKFGGYFAQDPTDPFNNNARAQSWTPPLNQSWNWGKDQILGVNLGGWLVLEPFITPALYQKYPTAIDEWTLHTAMAADQASGGLNQLEEHYKTFITEEDFAQIAGAGLNWVRLPIPFWAIDTWAGEPFLPKVCWKYALKAFDWARKYGIRILLDLHSVPGSQNGYNHSGQSGKVNLLNGVMGIANAQRLLHYIRIFTEFISQPQYKDVIPMFGIVNEPTGMPDAPLFSFYVEAYRMIRNITGIGAGNGPIISIQGGSSILPPFTGADRIGVEQHPYFAFGGGNNQDVVPFIPQPCSTWGSLVSETERSNGIASAAEWSLGFNDCGLMLHSTLDQHSTTPCTQWDQWENYTPTQKENLMSFAKANMDAFQHWFFWTWKVAPGATEKSPRAPLWSYKLGVDNGWIPKNPRDANGFCASLGVALPAPFDGNFKPYQTGGPGTSGVIDDADLAKYGQWPPVAPNATLLPTYTATGPVPTLPTQTFPAPTRGPKPTATGGNGWANSADTAKGITTVAGCTYPNAWDAIDAPVPTAACAGA